MSADETTQVSVDVPMRAERDPIMFELDDEEDAEPRRSPLRLIVVGIILIASVAVVLRPDLVETLDLDESIETITGLIDDVAGSVSGTAASSVNDTATPDSGIDQLEDLPEAAIADLSGVDASDTVVEELLIDPVEGSVSSIDTEPANASTDSAVLTEDATSIDDAEPDPLPPPIDFSILPEPTLLMSLGSGEAGDLPGAEVTIREDSEPAIVDLVREGDLTTALDVQFVETQFSGNQSSWEAGQYAVQNNGSLRFERGQPRARTLITMRSNPVREPDRAVTLVVRDAETRSIDLGTIRLTLEDDDQRAFEASLPSNTVGFAVNQVSVRESDSAVQVDVIRYRPGNTALEVPYTLTDVTATEGQDYFAPSLPTVYFGPGERTARILIPLGQDARVEQDEAFMLELDTSGAPANSNIFGQIAVMIRDDDS